LFSARHCAQNHALGSFLGLIFAISLLRVVPSDHKLLLLQFVDLKWIIFIGLLLLEYVSICLQWFFLHCLVFVFEECLGVDLFFHGLLAKGWCELELFGVLELTLNSHFPVKLHALRHWESDGLALLLSGLELG
jgi:hypothetical protein